VRGKTGHFLDFLAFDQIKTRIIDIFTCALKHCTGCLKKRVIKELNMKTMC
jgi:hypothetical protein